MAAFSVAITAKYPDQYIYIYIYPLSEAFDERVKISHNFEKLLFGSNHNLDKEIFKRSGTIAILTRVTHNLNLCNYQLQ